MPPRKRNTQADKTWIAEQKRALRVTPEGLLQWTGRAADIGNPYQMPPDEVGARCLHDRPVVDDEGQNILDADGLVLRARCPKWCIPGAAFCSDHSGGRNSAKALAKKLAEDASVQAMGELKAIAFDPLQDADTRLKALNSLLDRAGVKGGLDITLDAKGYEEILDKIIAGDDDGAND
jgi:hypothetical protein